MNEQPPIPDQESNIETQEVQQSPVEKGKDWLEQKSRNASETLVAHGIDRKSLGLVMRITSITILGERLVTAPSIEEKASIVSGALLAYGWNKIRGRLEEKSKSQNDYLKTMNESSHTIRLDELSKEIKQGDYGTN